MNLSCNTIYYCDSLDLLKVLDGNVVDFIYIDPPFNTGKTQTHITYRSVQDNTGTIGFGNNRYTQVATGVTSYDDTFDDYLGFLRGRLMEAKRVLKPIGSIMLHCDFRESHHIKILLDEIFGQNNFMNEIIWSYDYGGKPKVYWPRKHDTIFWYVMDNNNYTFNYDAIERIPYKAPGLVGPEKAARGKIPTDVWEMTIVPTNSKEKTGYATQKPMHLLRRIISVHTNMNDIVLDFFGGSGTTAAVCQELGRNWLTCDNSLQAVEIMSNRLNTVYTTIGE